MTDSICHSSLPRTVLEKVTDYFPILYSSAHKSRPNVSMCVYYYATEELSIQKYMARVAEKTRLNICANKKRADQPARPRRLISAFVVRCSSFFFRRRSVSQT